MVQVKEKVCLIVHDGWGIAPPAPNAPSSSSSDAIRAAQTPNMDSISSQHSARTLAAHGLAVGLKEGLMGNSEVGHLNIGAGRIVWQDIVRIDQSIRKRELEQIPAVVQACERAKGGNGRLHFLGLISTGGVHSHLTHLHALLRTASSLRVPNVYIHFFGDGRDTDPRSAVGYVGDLVRFIEELNKEGTEELNKEENEELNKEEHGGGEKKGKTNTKTRVELASIIGRYYAMDRDKRWERVGVAVRGLVEGEGEALASGVQEVVESVKRNYAKNITDEFLKPIIVNGDEGRIKENDTLFFFNYRSDRMREIVSIFGSAELGGLPEGWPKGKGKDGSEVPGGLHITTMSRYKAEFPFPVAFPPQTMGNVLAEILSAKGVKQAHVAETEKYAHVTFFFNGGVEKQFPNETRHMIPSPSVATYDLQPEMSVKAVAEKVAEVLKQGENEFVMCNFAPPDMVGHTGNFDAAVKAITATDEAVGIVYRACQEAGYILLITADHGNAEQMKNFETGAPHTAHTTNKVPFIMSGDPKVYGFKEDKRKKEKLEGDLEAKAEEVEEEEGALCDVAPTVLELMGIEKPEEMTGRSLLLRK